MTRKTNRHPTKKNSVEPTYTHPLISIGTKEKHLLNSLNSNSFKRFNIKEYSRINKIPRSTIYDILNRLDNLELIKRELGNNKITEKGKIYLDTTKGVGGVSVGVSEKTNLSAHFSKFHLKIKDRTKFKTERINYIKNNGFKENNLKNLNQVIIDFDDAKVIINPKHIILNLFEVIGENVEETDIKLLDRALKYAELFKRIGIETEGLMVEEGHWARMESILSDFLYEKIDKRYYLELEDGTKFWIDHSLGKREDETNNKLTRERIDKFLTDIASNDYNLKDIDKIKESLGFITKLEAYRQLNKISPSKIQRDEFRGYIN